MVGLKLGLGLGMQGVAFMAVPIAPPYVAPEEEPDTPPVGDPTPPVDTPIDPDTGNPEPGVDPNFVEATRIELSGDKQTVIRTEAEPGNWGNAYVAAELDGYDYWEIHIAQSTPRNATMAIGATNTTLPLNGIPGDLPGTAAYWSDGKVRQNEIDTTGFATYGRGDKISIARDKYTGRVWFAKNGNWLGSTPAASGSGHQATLSAAPPYYPFIALYSGDAQATFKFITSKFAYAAPSGFYPIFRTPAAAFTSGPLATDGATFPIYGAIHQPAFYDATLGMTFLAWEAWTGVRTEQTTSLNHATGYFTDIEGAGSSTLSDNDHGNPTIVLDHEDYLHAFYGAHSTTMKHSVTRWEIGGTPLTGSRWAIQPEIAGSYTYPHPVMVSGVMHLFMRGFTTSTRLPLVLYKTTSLSGGVAAWGSELPMVDFGLDSRVYMGPAFLVGTKIHFVATKADGGDTIREHVYYFVYDTVNGDLENHDGSFSVASGSLPMGLTDANTNCRLFTHSGGNGGQMPVLAFDTAGDPFVAFLDGATTSYALKVIKRTAGTWGSPVTVATQDQRHAMYALGQLPSLEMELFYEDDPGAAWARGGNIMRKVRASGGTWGSATTILAATSFALGQPNIVRNAHTDARVMFTEHTQDSLDASAGDLKVYLWGTSGLVGYQQAPTATLTTSIDGDELREDGFVELREDDFNELREVAL